MEASKPRSIDIDSPEHSDNWRCVMRRLLVSTMLVSGLLLAITGAASAQTTEFNAKVLGHLTRPPGPPPLEPLSPCPDGASLCGQTTLDGFGPAEFSILFTDFVPTSDACGDYTAVVTFMLDDGSVLTLDEVGVACGSGPSFLKGPLFTAFGNPRSWSGTWQVNSGTGQFDGLTGSGADAGLTAGAAVRATYRGTVGP
jgi:hypothetical protein